MKSPQKHKTLDSVVNKIYSILPADVYKFVHFFVLEELFKMIGQEYFTTDE